jgi:L,D-transpeptidase catalytic domain
VLFHTKLASAVLFSSLIANTVPLRAAPAVPAVSDARIGALLKLAPRLSPQALEVALTALHRLQASGAKVRSDILTVIDYTKPSTERRLWVFDLAHMHLLFEELTAHGKNSGDNQAVRFSNAPNSLMTSLGAFLTGDTYIGKHGLSLRLQGLEKGVNDNSMERAIVIHAAAYVSDPLAKATGRIGRSWGCPAVRPEISRRLIETVQGGSLVIAYYPDRSWLQNSKLAGLSTSGRNVSGTPGT